MDNFKIIDLGLVPPPPKKTILIVDDETAMHSLMFDMLSRDYNLIFASDGQAGFDKAVELLPDIILMDMMMPSVNGYDAVRLLGENIATKKIPVIVVTARHFDPTTVQLLKAEQNVVAFVNKPFRPQELRNVIKSKLELPPK